MMTATGLQRFGYDLFQATVIALAAALVAPPGEARAAAPIGKVVALAHDDATGTLFMAATRSIYSRGEDGRRWTALGLPPQLAGRSIEAMTVADRGTAVYVATLGGVLRSSDGGESWSAVDEGLPEGRVAALAAHADDADTVYAYATDGGFFRSEDGGAHWRLMDEGPLAKILQLVHSNMPGSMQTGWLFAATDQGVRRSMDCFCGWRTTGGLDGTVRAVTYDPDHPERLYALTDDGLFSSPSGGEHWDHVSVPSPGIVALLAAASDALYAAEADGTLFLSTDRAETWERVDAL